MHLKKPEAIETPVLLRNIHYFLIIDLLHIITIEGRKKNIHRQIETLKDINYLPLIITGEK